MLRSILLTVLLAPLITASQMVLNTGTELSVAAGTNVRIDGPLTLTLAPGSALVNDGRIAFGTQATLDEPLGNAITGTGTESTARLYTGPLSNTDAAGLGFSLTTAVAPDSLILVRGHVPKVNNLGAESIARWYRVRSGNVIGLSPSVVMSYDPTELNNIPELALRMGRNTDGNAWWPELASTIDPGLHTATASIPDSLGWFTLFDDALISAVTERGGIAPVFLVQPSIASERIVISGASDIEDYAVFDADGRCIRTHQTDRASTVAIDVTGLAAGAYVVRVNGRHMLRFVKA